ncbi:melanocyte-stimulating hormone receptor-like [Montipora foliosa]|uniref:melanocyte-stimulating hormone receptor-like n=1 Tax=Montipora foliosa TaxID=591990 RepID=UPI0035F19D8D
MANYSKDENLKTMTDFLCSSELTDGIHGELRWAAALNIFLSFTAFIGNAIFLAALNKVSTLHPPSKLLFRTLATTDLCVGIISQPLTAVALMPEVKKNVHVCRHTSIVRFLISYALCMVSLLTSTAINVDRLFALSLRIRYKQLVTLKRTYVIVAIFWVISIAFTVLSLFINSIRAVYWGVVLASCLTISAFSYGKIVFVLRRSQHQFGPRALWQRQPNQTVQLNATLYRKTVYTILWVQMALIICYLPYTIITLLLSNRTGRPSAWLLVAWRYAGTLVYFNSSLNPVLYCWKMRAVKNAMNETFQQTFCWLGQIRGKLNNVFVVNGEQQTTASSSS